MNAKVLLWAVVRNESRRAVRGRTVCVISVHCLLKSKGSAVIRILCFSIFLVRSLQTLVRARRTVDFVALQFVLCTVVTGAAFTLSCFCWEVSRVDTLRCWFSVVLLGHLYDP